jgi:hypothetical protein
MELIFNIISLIKELNDHINDYICDDEMINTVLRKILSINPQLKTLSFNLEDPIVNANCQSLFHIITKIKKDIQKYQSYNKLRKLTNIRDLKKSIEQFDKELVDIFRNLKLNTILDNSKMMIDLKTHIVDDISINKEILNIKMNSIKIKKDSLNEIDNINEKIKFLQNKIDDINIIKYYDLYELMNNIYDFEKKYEQYISSLNENVIKLECDFLKIKDKINYKQHLNNIYIKIEEQNNKILYQESFMKYFCIFLVEQFFYYVFVVLFYIVKLIFIDDKVYT